MPVTTGARTTPRDGASTKRGQRERQGLSGRSGRGPEASFAQNLLTKWEAPLWRCLTATAAEEEAGKGKGATARQWITQLWVADGHREEGVVPSELQAPPTSSGRGGSIEDNSVASAAESSPGTGAGGGPSRACGSGGTRSANAAHAAKGGHTRVVPHRADTQLLTPQDRTTVV